MNTPTHALIAALVFARPGARLRSRAAVLGGVFPDLPIFALWLWAKLAGLDESEVWRELYFSPGWRDAMDASHSVPLYAAIVLLLCATARPAPAGGTAPGTRWALRPPAVFCWSALFHIAGDFPLHFDDAHAHFWPLSDWRFRSPVSYWDAGHYGRIWAPFEAVLAVVMIVALWRRYDARWVRAVLALGALSYLAVPVYFSWMAH